MPLFICKHCGEQASLREEEAGREVHCRRCGGLLDGRASSGETESVPPPCGVGEAETLPPSPGNNPECTGRAATPVGRLDPDLANHPRYEVTELLGSGGMGAVYKATHRLMKRTVALKVIKEELVADPSHVERFHREVEAAARLHHPNIVTAYDADQAGRLHLLVMEYVRGKDLRAVLAERGPLPVAEACAYVRQAALGLQHAMGQGLVHRDIKPQNLILTPGGQVKVLDFGLASLNRETVTVTGSGMPAPDCAGADRLTLAGAIMGTPDYMAPEQASDTHTADIRADIYSLGCTLYCLLTGEPPFPGGTSLDKILAHSERSPRPIRETRKDVPKALARLLGRMMAKDPRSRPQTPAEVAQALEAIERNLVPCPAGVRVAGWLWVAWGALTVCAAAGFATYLLIRLGRSPGVAAPLIGMGMLALLPLIFIWKGVWLLRGRSPTPVRDGLGSMAIGLILGQVGLLFGTFLTRSFGGPALRQEDLVPWVLAPIFLASGVTLTVAGLLLLINTKKYWSWVRRADTQGRQ